MKTLMVTICAAAVIGMGLCACAGSTGSSGFTRNAALGQHIDVGKVVAVNRWASRRGATVLWINYPTYPAREDKRGG
jgi:hypothetical protein